MNEPVRLEAGPLRITFQRSGDRYSHRIELVTAAGTVPLLESIEGTPDEHWPPSPPWQELHVENRPGGNRWVLLVGRAGRSHWSAGVEFDASRGRIVFDVACRVHEPPGWLGGWYRVLQCVAAADPLDGIDLSGGCSLRTEVIDGERADLELPADGRFSLAAPAASGPWPCTPRWRYCVQADDVGGSRLQCDT